ncbi:MAG: hypothetical protein H7122_09970 [Chitinophagaceae bacterium]|nr:hypothetical protein [Chitinophagaceae bacterium]
MDDSFEIPVLFNQKELLFPARLLHQGFTHKIKVDVNGLTIIFEPDEEGNYRAIIDDILLEKANEINISLLKTIAVAIESIVR